LVFFSDRCEDDPSRDFLDERCSFIGLFFAHSYVVVVEVTLGMGGPNKILSLPIIGISEVSPAGRVELSSPLLSEGFFWRGGVCSSPLVTVGSGSASWVFLFVPFLFAADNLVFGLR